MATEKILKLSKWFSNKSLRLSLHPKRSRSSHSSLSSSRSLPMSPCTIHNKSSGEEGSLREVFRHFDGDGDGKISAYELRSYFGSIGEYMSHEEAEEVIHDLDSDGDNLLDFKDFKKLMKREGRDGGDDEDLRKAFEMFVCEKEGSGCITPKGLQRMLHRLGDEKSHDECVAMINAFDIDHNGVLDFNEFHQMMA
ncbi:probable calcium-binding protein CML41 [Gastrolobium bilobum]|uniref:probable calcium-binding protein CML41 n=1 Tax=Gastrolobium bilobum TaxID=150636 RepID=UPI002AB230B1|nr:probable calcium-binding protein CML41 [Gastrolobium bilobum]